VAKKFAFALGRRPKEHDPRTLKLVDYLDHQLAPPASVDWATKVHYWDALGNDLVGDCAWAAQGHAEMLWGSASGHPIDITTAECLKAYSAVTGFKPDDHHGPFGTNPTDVGTSLLSALKYWRSTGVGPHPIEAFCSIEPGDVDHLKLAIDLFGCAYVGVYLPDAVLPDEKDPGPYPTWTVVPNGDKTRAVDQDNGHCIIYAAYDESGPTVITWGKAVAASWDFHRAYCDEVYAVLSPDFLKRHQTPAGVKLDALRSDLKKLSA
jgi:hypothetical protein